MPDQLPPDLRIVLPGGLSIPPRATLNNEQIEAVEAELLQLPQVDCALVHRFAPGVYMREVLMPAGSFIIGHEHKTQHLNIVLTGSAIVMINGEPHKVEAPYTFQSEAGVRKCLFVLEDMRWATIHPTDETDLEKLADALIVKSPSFLHYHKDLRKLREIAESLHD